MKNERKSTSLCFRRWSRKKYAAFASMGKVVKIGVLLSGFSMVCLPTTKGESTLRKDSLTTDRELSLNEVTVVGSKVDGLQNAATTLPVITKRDVDRLPIVSIESALKQSAGIDIRERGTKGVQADLSIRGGSFDQSVIFLNGVNFTDSRTGHQNLSLPIDIEIVDKINLLHGLTTPGAITGGINLITASSDKNYLNTEVNSGQYGYQLYRMNGNYHFRNANLFAAASHKRSEGYISNTDFETTNAFLHFKHTCPIVGQVDFQAGFQDKAFGANSFYTATYPNQFEANRTWLSSLGWNRTFNRINITSNISYKRVYDRFELFRGSIGAPSWYKSPNFHRTDDAGISFLASYQSSFGKTFVGADYKYSHIYSNNIGDSIGSKIPVYGETNAFYYLQKRRETTNIFVKQRLNLSQFQFEGNVNYVFTQFGDKALWGASGRYALLKWLNVTANANHNIRIPTFTDLYYKSSTQISNPNLNIESSTTFDLGVNAKISNLTASASVFNRKISEMIDWVKYSPADKWRAVNYSEMNTTGFELSAVFSFPKSVKIIRADFTHLNSDNPAGKWISKYALCYVKNKLAVSSQIDLTQKLSLGLVGTYWDRNASFSEVSGALYNYNPYFTIDSKLMWTEKHYSIKIECSNLTDTKYFDFGGLMQPGSWVNAGVIVKI